MSDLISRSALKDALEYWTNFPKHRGGKSVYDIIDDAPAVDAVEVVRCRDCKWALPNDASNDWVNCSNCFEVAQRKEWYCADGERRADNGTP